MHTHSLFKNRLNKLYFFVLSSNYCLPYKYIVVKAFTSGRLKILYLLRFLFPLNRVLQRLFLVLASSISIFTPLLRGSSSFLLLRFCLLILHHFIFFYEIILTLRFVAEWYPSINLHEGGVVGQIIFTLSEPYFKAFEEILPRGLSAIFSFFLVEQLKSIPELIYRALVLYGGNCRKKSWIQSVDLLSLALFGEKILPV